LLEKGINIEAKEDIYGRTALHLAAIDGHEVAARLLLEKGANIHAEKEDGWTALHLAAWNGSEAVARLLLEKGADIEAKNSSHGRTALHLAALGGQKVIVRLLLVKGADATAMDAHGWSALHLTAVDTDWLPVLHHI
jgi:ankyrin repeat protein